MTNYQTNIDGDDSFMYSQIYTFFLK